MDFSSAVSCEPPTHAQKRSAFRLSQHFGFLSINSNYTVIEIRLHFLESFVNMALVVLTDTVNLDDELGDLLCQWV